MHRLATATARAACSSRRAGLPRPTPAPTGDPRAAHTRAAWVRFAPPHARVVARVQLVRSRWGPQGLGSYCGERAPVRYACDARRVWRPYARTQVGRLTKTRRADQFPWCKLTQVRLLICDSFLSPGPSDYFVTLSGTWTDPRKNNLIPAPSLYCVLRTFTHTPHRTDWHTRRRFELVSDAKHSKCCSYCFGGMEKPAVLLH